jgi:hypothetical protein
MRATSQYMKFLMNQKAAARGHDFTLRRMHELGLEFKKPQEPLPAWAEAFSEKIHRYWGGGIEAENVSTVG